MKRNAIALAKAARLLQLPVLLAAAAIPGDAGVFLKEVVETLPDAPIIGHSTNNCWQTPEFAVAVERSGRRHLVMAGVATDVGLCLPALSARQAGYPVTALVDVSGTLNARVEQAAWLRMTAAGVSLNLWSGFVAEAQGDYTRELGPRLRALIGESLSAHSGPTPFG